jgi:uncharacterized protein YjiS (DUF1127 family)
MHSKVDRHASFQAALEQAHAGSERARSWPGVVRRWMQRSQQRWALSELANANDHLLQDIGLSREEARREAAKPFWRR